MIEPPQSEDAAGQATPPPSSFAKGYGETKEAAAPAPEPEQTPTPTETPAQAEVSESVPESVPEPQTQNEPAQSNSPAPSSSAQGSGGTQQPATASAVAPTSIISELLTKARAKIQDRRKKKLEKIMTKLSETGKITNNEVQKLLRVSDATATRYLDSLEKEGRVRQEGKTGKHVVYIKI